MHKIMISLHNNANINLQTSHYPDQHTKRSMAIALSIPEDRVTVIFTAFSYISLFNGNLIIITCQKTTLFPSFFWRIKTYEYENGSLEVTMQ